MHQRASKENEEIALSGHAEQQGDANERGEGTQLLNWPYSWSFKPELTPAIHGFMPVVPNFLPPLRN